MSNPLWERNARALAKELEACRAEAELFEAAAKRLHEEGVKLRALLGELLEHCEEGWGQVSPYLRDKHHDDDLIARARAELGS